MQTFKNWHESKQNMGIERLCIDIPMFIRLLEYAKEDAKTDLDLHRLTENLINIQRIKDVLTMQDYQKAIKVK